MCSATATSCASYWSRRLVVASSNGGGSGGRSSKREDGHRGRMLEEWAMDSGKQMAGARRSTRERGVCGACKCHMGRSDSVQWPWGRSGCAAKAPGCRTRER